MSKKKQRNAAKAPDKKVVVVNSSGGKLSKTQTTALAMALGGAFLGFLAGLNQWPVMPAANKAVAPGLAWLGGVLGVQRVQNFDINSAVQGGCLGLVVGLGLALSFAYSERKMLNTWVLSACGLFVATSIFHNPVAAAGGWVLGWMLGMAAPPKA